MEARSAAALAADERRIRLRTESSHVRRRIDEAFGEIEDEDRE